MEKNYDGQFSEVFLNLEAIEELRNNCPPTDSRPKYQQAWNNSSKLYELNSTEGKIEFALWRHETTKN